jgi:hypothetical protein
MNPELKRAIEEVIEAVESASELASRESRLDMMEVLCAIYQLKRVFAQELQELQAPKTKRKITRKWISPSEKF